MEDMQKRIDDLIYSTSSSQEPKQEPIELVSVKIERFKWESIVAYFKLIANTDYTITQIAIKDDFFDNDLRYKELKKISNKAYTEFKEYEFNQRNK